MKSDIKLSFVIPCYNSEYFIAKCLDSIYGQNVSETEYEVICINDCSPDNTRDMIVEYQKKHDNLVLIDNEHNLMQGGTRNVGIKTARGKYLWFIDADDFIEKDCLKNMLEILNKYDLDILNFDFYDYFENGKVEDNSISQTSEVISGRDWMIGLTGNFDTNASPWRRIMKTKLLLDNNLFFPQRRYEDQFFTMFAVYSAKKFKHINQYIYYYFHNNSSTINERLTAVNYISSVECGADYLNFYERIKTSDPVFAERVKMSGLWKINFGCKELRFFTAQYRKRLTKAVLPHLSIINSSNYFAGFTKKYFVNFTLFNSLFCIVSPVFRFLRKYKRIVKKKRI